MAQNNLKKLLFFRFFSQFRKYTHFPNLNKNKAMNTTRKKYFTIYKRYCNTVLKEIVKIKTGSRRIPLRSGLPRDRHLRTGDTQTGVCVCVYVSMCV